MKWNGTVSHSPPNGISSRFSAAKSPQASSIRRLRSTEPVSDAPNGVDDVRAELRAEAAYAHVDDVRTGVECEAPDVGEQLLAGADLVAPADEVLEQQELPARQRDL